MSIAWIMSSAPRSRRLHDPGAQHDLAAGVSHQLEALLLFELPIDGDGHDDEYGGASEAVHYGELHVRLIINKWSFSNLPAYFP